MVFQPGVATAKSDCRSACRRSRRQAVSALSSVTLQKTQIMVESRRAISQARGVAKPVLGRKLDVLLNGDRIAGKTDAASPAMPASGEPLVGPGVGALFKGFQTDDKTKAAASPFKGMTEPGVWKLWNMPAWYFWGADLVLLSLAAVILLKSSSPPSWPQVLLCGLAIALGAALGLAPVLMNRKTAPPETRTDTNPKWILAGDKTGAAGRVYVVHLHQPRFIAELIEADQGKPTLTPVWIEESPGTSSENLNQLLRMAETWCKTRTEQ